MSGIDARRPRIRLWREDRDTLRELARRIGVSPNALSLIQDEVR